MTMPSLTQHRQSVGELFRFGLIGISATLCHLVLLWSAVELLGIAPVLANGLAFCISMILTYLGQSIWVFGVRAQSGRQMVRFMVSAVFGLLANLGLMALTVNVLGWHYLIGFLLVVTLVPAASFVINKFWVFRAGNQP